MEEYTIYCTEEQTKKALELGAPIIQTHENPSMSFIERYPKRFWVSNDDSKIDVGYVFGIPTAEQMIGWLMEELEATTFINQYYPCADKTGYGYLIISKGCVLELDAEDGGKYLYDTNKEATLAAIDAALDYLKNKK